MRCRRCRGRVAGGRHRIGGGAPLRHPRVGIAVLDPADGRQHLARVRIAAIHAAQRDLVPKLEIVVLEQRARHVAVGILPQPARRAGYRCRG